jgi:ligand-binding sensor domain-containing protein
MSNTPSTLFTNTNLRFKIFFSFFKVSVFLILLMLKSVCLMAQTNQCQVSTISDAANQNTIYVCAGDGKPDLANLKNSLNATQNFAYVLATVDNKIIKIIIDPLYDLENAPANTVLIWGFNYTGDIIAKQGESVFTTPFSTGCYYISRNCIAINRVNTEGGTVKTAYGAKTYFACQADPLNYNTGFQNMNAGTAPYLYLLTDNNNTILEIITRGNFDFNTYPKGNYRVWGLSYTGQLSDIIGKNAASFKLTNGCFDLSDDFVSITVGSPSRHNIAVVGSSSLYFELVNNTNSTFSLSNTASNGAKFAYMVVDENQKIVKVLTQSPYDLSFLSVGKFFIWGVSYLGDLNATIGKNIFDGSLATGCYHISDNAITLQKKSNIDCVLRGATISVANELKATTFPIDLKPTSVDLGTIPSGYEVLYLLLKGESSDVIRATSNTASFSISDTGKYAIGVLIGELSDATNANYINPNTLVNTSISALKTANTNKCFSINTSSFITVKKELVVEPCSVKVATIVVDSEVKTMTFPIDFRPTFLDLGTVPNGYEVLYLLLKGEGTDIIRATSNTASFSISDTGKYAFGVLIAELSDATNANYINPNVLVNTSIAALKTANISKCFSINISPFIPIKKTTVVEPCVLRGATIDIIPQTWVNYTTTDNVLPENDIRSISVDKQNNKWVATFKGVTKFDGTNWTTYNPTNSGLPHIWVLATGVDSQDVKWFLTLDGLSKFNGTAWTNYKFPSYDSESFLNNTLTIDGEGNKWVATNFDGVLKLDNNGNWTVYNTTNSGIASNFTSDIAIDLQGNKWIVTTKGVSKFDGTNWTTYNSANSGLLSDSTLSCVIIDKQGNKWFGDNGGITNVKHGVTKFDGTNWVNYNSTNSPLTNDLVRDIVVDAQGVLWFATNNGISKFDGTTWTNYNTENSGIVSNFTTCIAFDTQGGKWFGSFRGISKFCDNLSCNINREIATATFPIDLKPTKVDLGTVPSGYEVLYLLFKGENSDVIRATSSTASFPMSDTGKYAIGVMIAELSDAANPNYINPNNLVNTSVAALKAANPNKCYTINVSPLISVFKKAAEPCILTGASIEVLDPKWVVYTTANSGIVDDITNSLLIDKQNNKWVATYKGVSKLQDSTWTSYSVTNSGLPNNTVYSIGLDSQDVKWFVTLGGLAKFNGTSWTNYRYPTLNSSTTMAIGNDFAIDGQGNKWIGTSLDGVLKLDNSGNWTKYNTTNSGIPNNSVRDIAIDLQGNKWFVTRKGISKFDGINWITYNRSNSGLLNDSTLRCVTIDKQGNKWFGSDNKGVTKFDGTNWTTYNSANSGLTDNSIKEIGVDAQGDIWFCSYFNITKFNGTTWKKYSNPSLFYDILSIGFDKEGNKWFGASFDGIAKLCDTLTGDIDRVIEATNFPISLKPTRFGYGTVPGRYDVKFLLFKGRNSDIIQAVSDSETFSVSDTGLYSIGLLIGELSNPQDPEYINTNNLVNTSLAAFKAANPNKCFTVTISSLISVIKKTVAEPCVLRGATIAVAGEVKATTFPLDLKPTSVNLGTVPSGNEVLYLLIKGEGTDIIRATSSTASFSISDTGKYAIGVLIGELSDATNINYINPNTLVNTSIATLKTANINKCFSVNTSSFISVKKEPVVEPCVLRGATIAVAVEVKATTFPIDLKPVSVDLGTVPSGYEVLYLLFNGEGSDVIKATSNTALFSISDTGKYAIGVLIGELSDATNPNYINPNALINTSLATFNTTNALKCFAISKSATISVTKIAPLILNCGLTQQKIVASDRWVEDEFGSSTAVSGDFAIVGSPKEDEDVLGVNPISNAGSAYISKRQADGTWKQVQKIVASDRALEDQFGYSVAINGNYAFVGAWQQEDEATNLTDAGCVYVFKKQNDSTWTEIQKLTASDRSRLDFFSNSMAVSGDNLIVGAYQADGIGTGTTKSNFGSAYIFQKQSDGTWKEVQKIVANDKAANDKFGFSVAINGDQAVVGTKDDAKDQNGSNPILGAGSAYIYKKQANGSWTQVQKIVASNRGTDELFGYSVAISNDYVLVGVPARYGLFYPNGPTPISAHLSGVIFYKKQINGSWLESQAIVGGSFPGDNFGISVAMSGDYAVIGKTQYVSNDGGFAVTYKQENGKWTSTDRLQPVRRSSLLDNGKQFGRNLAIDNTTVIVGDVRENFAPFDNRKLPFSGSAYLFSLPDLQCCSLQDNFISTESSIIANSFPIVFRASPINLTNVPGNSEVRYLLFKSTNPDIIQAVSDSAVFSIADTGKYAIGIFVGELSDATNSNFINPNTLVKGQTLTIFNTTNQGKCYKINTSGFPTIRKPLCDSIPNKIVATDRSANSSRGVSNSYYGGSVDISGDYAIVGADNDNSDFIRDNGGSVYIYKRSNENQWAEIQKIKGPRAYIKFGTSVAIDGKYAVVGAPNSKSDSTFASILGTGEAYILELQTDGTWVRKTIIEASDRDNLTRQGFGYSVDISGNMIIIGSKGNFTDSNGLNPKTKSGSAYIYQIQTNGTIKEIQKIVASDRAIGAEFGTTVKIAGDYAFVGADNEDYNSNGSDLLSNAGSVYVFRRQSNGTWLQIQKLVASDRKTEEAFGNTIDAKGDYLLIAPAKGRANGGYIFKKQANGTWLEIQKLPNLNPVTTGIDTTKKQNIAINENFALIGVYGIIDKAGQVAIYEKQPNDKWILTNDVTAPDAKIGDFFGYSVAIDNRNTNNYIVGAIRNTTDLNCENTLLYSGSAYILKASNSVLCDSIPNKIVANDRRDSTFYGVTVDISGDYAIVGAEDDNSNGLSPNAGSAYIYKRNRINQWVQVQKISSNFAYSKFGFSVAIKGKYAVVGAPYSNFNTSTFYKTGGAYVFELQSNGVWIEKKFIRASDFNSLQSQSFGYSVDIDGNDIIIGSVGNNSDTNRSDLKTGAGSAYIFQIRDDGTIVETQKIVASDRAIDANFGTTVKIVGDNVLVGASSEDYNSNGIDSLSNAGSVYVFRRQSNGSWLQTQKLAASDRKAENAFGNAIDARGDYLLIAPAKGRTNGGYIFKKQANGTWLEIQKLPNLNPVSTGVNTSKFENIALNENYAMIGVYGFSRRAGKVAIYQKQPNDTWVFIKDIMATDSAIGDSFGYSVAMDNDNYIVGALGNTTGLNCENTITKAGSAYIFPISTLPQALTQTGTSTNTFNMKVAPNPLQDQVEVFLQNDESKPTDVLLYDAFGKLLFSKQKSMERQLTIDMTTFADGLYILIAKQGENQAVQKLIKTNSR